MRQFNIGDKVWLYHHSYFIETGTVTRVDPIGLNAVSDSKWIAIVTEKGDKREDINSRFFHYPEDVELLVDNIEYDTDMMRSVCRSLIKEFIMKKE